MNIKIKKAKLCKGGSVEAVYIDPEGNEITIKGKNKCHNDMRVAIAKLVPFLADITEQKEADRIDWDDLDGAYTIDLLRKLEVTGVSVGGDGGNPDDPFAGAGIPDEVPPIEDPVESVA